MSKKSDKLIPVSDYKPKDIRLRTGVFVLDLLLGGGIPLWRYVIFHGKESSGKTTLALRTVGNFLTTYPNVKVLYLDVEKTFDKTWAEHFIKDTKNLFLAQPDYGEEAVDLAVETMKDDSFGLLVVDSLAELIPVADADKSAMEDTFASIPKLANKLLRKLLPIMGFKEKNNIPAGVLILNQLTTNTNARGFQSPYKKPAGMLQNFIATVDIQCYTKDYKESKGLPIYVTHQFTIQKAKISGALAKRSGEYKMALVDFDSYKAGDVIDEEITVAFGRKAGIIQQSNGWVVLDKKFKNLPDIIEVLKSDKEFKMKLQNSIINICKNDIWKTAGKEE